MYRILNYIIPANINGRVYPTFGTLCRVIKRNYNDNVDLEKLPDFKVKLGKLNDMSDFSISGLDEKLNTSQMRKMNVKTNLFKFNINEKKNYFPGNN